MGNWTTYLPGREINTCVSTTTNDTNNIVLATATALQIRWAESDIRSFETHPLTYGLPIPTESACHTPRVSGGVDHLTPHSKILLVVSFLPIILILVGVLIQNLFTNYTSSGARSKRKRFFPLVFRFWSLAFILATEVSLTALLEVGYSNSANPSKFKDVNVVAPVTKTVVTEFTSIHKKDTLQGSDDCCSEYRTTATETAAYVTE